MVKITEITKKTTRKIVKGRAPPIPVNNNANKIVSITTSAIIETSKALSTRLSLFLTILVDELFKNSIFIKIISPKKVLIKINSLK